MGLEFRREFVPGVVDDDAVGMDDPSMLAEG